MLQNHTATQSSVRVFERILVPVDFSVESHVAIETAIELQRRFGSEICVFNLTTTATEGDFQPDDRPPEAREAHCKERLRILIDMLSPGATSNIALQVFVGEDVARWVHDVASAWPASVVLLAAHPSHTVFRSLTEKIVRALKIPVLILK